MIMYFLMLQTSDDAAPKLMKSLTQKGQADLNIGKQLQLEKDGISLETEEIPEQYINSSVLILDNSRRGLTQRFMYHLNFLQRTYYNIIS